MFIYLNNGMIRWEEGNNFVLEQRFLETDDWVLYEEPEKPLSKKRYEIAGYGWMRKEEDVKEDVKKLLDFYIFQNVPNGFRSKVKEIFGDDLVE